MLQWPPSLMVCCVAVATESGEVDLDLFWNQYARHASSFVI